MGGDPFDPARVHPPGELDPTPTPTGPPRHRQGEPFLRGPIPWAWVTTAAALPGKSLAVGLVLWREAGCVTRRTVRVTLARLAGPLLSVDAARRGVRALERVGLVTVEHRPGCGLVVTLNDAPAG